MNQIQAIKTLELESDGTHIRIPADWIVSSMTDDRGVITYANPAFTRVAGYGLDELVGAPHKIVRSPNMPKAVFWVYWNRLKAGKPVCAYVDNKARDGKFYWVCAVAMPYADGYVSVRIPAHGRYAKAARELYDNLLEAEAGGLSPEAAAQKLEQAVQHEGFAGYDDFMLAVLNEEADARGRALGRPVSARVTILREIIENSEKALALVQSMSEGFQNIRGEPVNMRILASRLENTGAAISTISQNYELMAGEMSNEIRKLTSDETVSLETIRAALQGACFDVLAADLMEETAAQTRHDAEETGVDHGQGIEALTALSQSMVSSNTANFRRIVDFSERIPDLCRLLRRRINGLDVVKLLCRVENGRIGKLDAGLTGIIDRLEKFHDETDRQLSDLSNCAQKIASKARALL